MLSTTRLSPTLVSTPPISIKSKTVLMVHLNEEQSKLWQTALISQKIEVIQQPPRVDLIALLEDYRQGNNLPDLLIIDIGVKSPDGNFLQASKVCRWIKREKLNLKVVLVSPNQEMIGKAEHFWVDLHGAIDVLPKLCEQNLLDSIFRVVEAMGSEFNESSLSEIFEPKPAIQIDRDLSNQNAESYFDRAIALLNQFDIQGAIEALNFAIQINPNYTEAYSKRADIYISIGDAPKAMEDYSRSLGIWHGDR